MKKIKLFLFLFLISVLIIGCGGPGDESIAGKGISTGVDTQETKDLIDPCDDLELIKGRITSLAEDVAEAETELDGLKVDLDFAQEDNVNVIEIEELITNQEKYLVDLNDMMTELQELIKEC